MESETMTLDEKIRELVAVENFSHLSITSDGEGKFWATFTPAVTRVLGKGLDEDPVKAALDAVANASTKRHSKET
jgi:hypothetical protein